MYIYVLKDSEMKRISTLGQFTSRHLTLGTRKKIKLCVKCFRNIR